MGKLAQPSCSAHISFHGRRSFRPFDQMPTEKEPGLRLEIGHVLSMDVVGYSKLLIHEQSELQKKLNDLVRATPQCQKADAEGKLIRLPTGDGMLLVFFKDPTAPIECATEVSAALKDHPEIQLRMGIHSGPVNEVLDVNERANVAGAGIDVAQRVMDCGDAGHILLSTRVADDLAPYVRWHPHLHNLGECEVKHGRRISLVNFYTDEVGNPNLPRALPGNANQSPSGRGRNRLILGLAFAAVLGLLALGGWFLSQHPFRSGANSNNSSSAVEVAAKSIAVLPLENLSEDKKDAFFADGIQDDILTSLAQVADLKVISRTSVMQYRGAARNLREIAKALGVANIVEGSVRRDGNRILVNIQLIDAQSDRHLWAHRFDRTLDDSIGLQGELAAQIATALQATLAPDEKTRLATKPTRSGDAYVLYLKANEMVHNASSKQDAILADKTYDEAIAIDPNYALARARASILNSLMFSLGRDAQRKTKAWALANEALRLSPKIGEAHLARAYCFYRMDADYENALQELALAGAASPNDSEILDASGFIYRRQGRWKEALAAFTRAEQLDPQQPHFDAKPSTLRILRQWPAAGDAYQHGVQLEPQAEDGWIGLAYVRFAQGDTPAVAAATLNRLPEAKRNTPFWKHSRWDYAMLARDFAEAEKIMPDQALDEFPVFQPKPFYEACVAIARGDAAAAQGFLEQIRPMNEKGVRDHPNDPTFNAALATVYTLMGRKEDAIRESRRAMELCPESQDAVAGSDFAATLAFAYARNGEPEEAITLLSQLLTTPGVQRITLAHLRASWEWDPLRTYPRFKALLEGPEPATIYH